MNTTIYRFQQLPADQLSQAGGKGSSLCRMAQAHYPVPDGLVILPAAFEDGHLKPQTLNDLVKQLADLRGGDASTTFAVRSSALAEDSAQTSFAGEFETVLDMREDADILAAVNRVRSSAGAERVKAYSQHMGVEMDHAMAVIVQRMVQPEFAGVLFTADPISGSHAQMTGNYVLGLGEGLVSGEANAQDFRLTRPGGKYQGPKDFRKYMGRLFRLAAKLENEFGCALDIEWAVAGGRVHLLQARPITTLRTIDYDTYTVNESLDHDFVWTNNNIGEALPDVMTPFTWSLTRELDIETQKLSGYYLWSGNICGRAYSNVSLIFSFMSKFGLSNSFSKKMVGNVFGIFPARMQMPVYPMGMVELLKDMSVRGRKNAQRIAYAKKHMEEYLQQNPAWCSKMVSRIQATDNQASLLALWKEEIRPHISKMWAIFLGGASDATLVTLQNRLEKMVGIEDANSLLSNIRGESGLESLGPLVGIAQVIKGELSREDYLAKYGHRSPHEFEMSFPYPVEDPAYLDQQIAEYQKSGVNVEGLLARQHEQFDQAKARFIQRYPAKQKWLEKSLEAMGRAARNRERLRSEFTRTFRVMRVFMLKAGDLTRIGSDAFFIYTHEIPQLLNSGAQTPEKHFLSYLPARRQNYERYCSLPQLPMFIKGRFNPFEWARQENRRVDYYDAAEGVNIGAANSGGKDGLIRGFAGAAGVIEGRVRVLSSYDEQQTFQPGEILVTSTTNVGWTPLFPRAAAIVTDIGAPLSHAAIVARELGIPAVVGCGDATVRLKTGDQVRVDGGRGLVEIMNKKE